jgi:hypothetical protein
MSIALPRTTSKSIAPPRSTNTSKDPKKENLQITINDTTKTNAIQNKP